MSTRDEQPPTCPSCGHLKIKPAYCDRCDGAGVLFDRPPAPAAPEGATALNGSPWLSASLREAAGALDGFADRSEHPKAAAHLRVLADACRTASQAPDEGAYRLNDAREFVTLENTTWQDTRDGRHAKQLAEKRLGVLAARIMQRKSPCKEQR